MLFYGAGQNIRRPSRNSIWYRSFHLCCRCFSLRLSPWLLRSLLFERDFLNYTIHSVMSSMPFFIFSVPDGTKHKAGGMFPCIPPPPCQKSPFGSSLGAVSMNRWPRSCSICSMVRCGSCFGIVSTVTLSE